MTVQTGACTRLYLPAGSTLPATRGWLLGNFIILLGSVVVLVGLSVAYIYPKNVWINAGPVILGVFLKSVLGSRVGLTIPGKRTRRNPPSQARSRRRPLGVIN